VCLHIYLEVGRKFSLSSVVSIFDQYLVTNY
jgi:hypothetical protein